MPTNHADVVVVGAGPTGLLLAGDLAAAGVPVALLEKRTKESNLTRAFAVHARTLELLDARGLADELIATGAQVRHIRPFGGGTVDLGRLPSRYPFLLVTPQYEVERLLTRRALERGARFVRGAEVTGLRQDGDGVHVDVRDEGGGAAAWRAGYLVGADGVRSGVRRALGLPFPGRSVLRSVMLADVQLEAPPTEALTVNGVRDAFAFVVPFGDGWYRVIAGDPGSRLGDDAPVDFDDLRATVRRALGTDYGMHNPRWTSRFHSDERQVPRYRQGRVFLAGDAAHVHSPAGGMGMNTGLQDASNLSWKLVAALRGHPPEAVLDSYNDERHPVGAMVLKVSGAILRAALVQSGPLRALRKAFANVALRSPLVTDRAARRVSGIDIAYPAPPGSHPAVGKRMPDLPLKGGRLYEALREGRFLLVAQGGAPATVVAPWHDRVNAVTPAEPTPTVTLVRPDGYIAWAAEGAVNEGALRDAVARWCGPPPVS